MADLHPQFDCDLIARKKADEIEALRARVAELEAKLKVAEEALWYIDTRLEKAQNEEATTGVLMQASPLRIDVNTALAKIKEAS